MTHTLSNRLAALIVARGWIDSSDFKWCSYAIEKRLGQTLFFTAVLIWAAFMQLIVETFVFVTVFCSYRSRMGGWHARHAWVCQLMSIALVILSVQFLGRALMSIEPYIVFIANLVLLAAAFFLKPAYPAQVYFTEREASANIKRKNWMLLILFLTQMVTWGVLGVEITVYSFLGLAISVLSIKISKIERRSMRNEAS